MGKRVVTGVVGAVLMIAVLLFGGEVGMTIAMAFIACVAAFELLRAAGFGWRDRLPAMAAAAAAVAVTLTPFGLEGCLAVGVVYGLWIMVACVWRHRQLSIERAGLLMFLPLVSTSGFAALAALRGMEEDGLLYVLLALVIPWLSDTGAYFVGVRFGRHKLCPVISPKKTVEGLVGGIVTSLLAVALTGWMYTQWCGHAVQINLPSLLVIAAVGAPLSVAGDLFASVVKRQYGVKDYGQIMPGHGGVMDRFDSVVPVAVLLLLWVNVWPLVL